MPNSNRWGNADIRWDLMELINERDTDIFNPMAQKILPLVNVTTTSGRIPVKDSGDGLRLVDIERAENGSYKRGRNILSDASFSTDVFGYEEGIDNMEDIEANEIINLESLNTEICRETLEVHQEKRVADLLFNTNTFAGGNDQQAATLTWNDEAALIRKNDIWPAADKLKLKRGLKRSSLSLIATIDAIDSMLLSTDIREAVKYSGPDSLDELSRSAQLAYLATFYRIKEIVEVDSSFNTSGFDIKAAFSSVWSDDFALLAKLSAPSDNRWTVGLGHQTIFKKATKGQDMIIESYEETGTDKLIIRAKHRIGETAFSDYGVLLTGINA